MQNEEYIRNLVHLIFSDGVVSDEERQHILRICSKLNFDKETLKKIIKEAREGKTEIQIPKDHDSRIALYTKMVQLAGIDGNISIKEKEILKLIASKIGLHQEEVEHIFDISKKKIFQDSISSYTGAHFAWAFALICIAAIGGIVFLIYEFLPSGRKVQDDASMGIATGYNDFKDGLVAVGSGIKDVLTEKVEKVIVLSLENIYSNPQLIIHKAKVNCKLTKKDTWLLSEANATLRVQDAKVQYLIDFSDFGKNNFILDENVLTIKIPKPKVDTEVVDTNDENWETEGNDGWLNYQSEELLTSLKLEVRNHVISKAREIDNIKTANELGLPKVQQLFQPILDSVNEQDKSAKRNPIILKLAYLESDDAVKTVQKSSN